MENGLSESAVRRIKKNGSRILLEKIYRKFIFFINIQQKVANEKLYRYNILKNKELPNQYGSGKKGSSMSENSSAKKSRLDRILDAIERAGNKLPDPITMFLGLAIIVTIISAICSAAGVSAVNPADGSTIEVFNLLSLDGIRYLWTNVITNFSGFAPLGMVLVAVIGSSVAEKSGFLVAVMVNFLGKAKGWIVTMVIMFLGINLNIAGDAGFIVLPPLAAILYMSIGRHPLLGMYTAFASVAAGFCANILLGLSDALAYGFTEQAAQMIDPNYQQSIAINWYFLIVSCVLLTIVGAIVGIVLFSPIMLIVALLIKLTSPGPIIFCQERVGLHNRPFKMYKFRSMTVQDPSKEKSRWTTKGDARVTLIGKIIRRTSIDEVPQFFNILMGDMSLVGPRPERPFFVEKFKEEIPRYMIKHQVRPGLTGWAQVNGYRGDTSIIKRIEHDLYYIENWTLGLDFKIMFLTVFKGFINKNAY